MVTFEDRFDRLDSVDLAGTQPTYGWLQHGAGVYGIELHDKALLNEGGSRAVALQLLTKPSKADTQVSAHVWLNVEAADARVFLGAYANALTLGDETTLLWGMGVSLLYEAGGVRTLEIWSDKQDVPGNFVPGLASPEVRKSVTVTDRTIKEGGNDLGVFQDLRFLLNQEREGTRIRAYLNQSDDARPTLETVLQRDVVPAPTDFLHWLIGFGNVIDDRKLAVLSFSAADLDFKKATDVVGRDTLILGDLMAMAKLRYEGSSSQTDFDEELAIQFANDAQEEIVNECGDLVSFLQPRERLTISADATTGYFTLPSYVEQVLMVETDVTFEPVVWVKVADGQFALSPGGSGEFWVTYQIRKERMQELTDASVIPRRFSEALVLGVVYRLAKFDSSARSYEAFKLEFREKLLQMKTSLNKLARASKPRLRVAYPTRNIVQPSRFDFWNRGGY